jgi:hypothetical protein
VAGLKKKIDSMSQRNSTDELFWDGNEESQLSLLLDKPTMLFNFTQFLNNARGDRRPVQRLFQSYMEFLFQQNSVALLSFRQAVDLQNMLKYAAALKQPAVLKFFDMCIVVHDYASLLGGSLKEKMHILSDKGGLVNQRKSAQRKSNQRVKTRKSLSNQLTVLRAENKILPIDELASKVIDFCQRTWKNLKPRVQQASSGSKKFANSDKLGTKERQLLSGLWVAVYNLSVYVARNCNWISLSVTDGLKLLEVDLLVHTQNKSSCTQQFCIFDSNSLSRAFLQAYIGIIRPFLCKYDRVVPPTIDEKDLAHMHNFMVLSDIDWCAYMASRSISIDVNRRSKIGWAARVSVIYEHCKPKGGRLVPIPGSEPASESLQKAYSLLVGGHSWHTKNRNLDAHLMLTAFNCSNYNTQLLVDHRGSPVADVGETLELVIFEATGCSKIREKKLKKIVHSAIAALKDGKAVEVCNKIHEHVETVGRENYTFQDSFEHWSTWRQLYTSITKAGTTIDIRNRPEATLEPSSQQDRTKWNWKWAHSSTDVISTPLAATTPATPPPATPPPASTLVLLTARLSLYTPYLLCCVACMHMCVWRLYV